MFKILLKNIFLYMIRIFNLKKQMYLNNLLLRKKIMMNRNRILMKNLEVGRIRKSRSCLITFKRIFHLGLKETKLNFTIMWLKMFCQIKKQLLLKVDFFFILKIKDFNLIFFKALTFLIIYS